MEQLKNKLLPNGWTYLEMAEQLTAYENYGLINYYAAIKDLILSDVLDMYGASELMQLWNDYCYSISDYDNEFFYNDSYTLNDLFNNDIERALRCAFYGGYHPNADFFKFDGYGNLESYFENEMIVYIKDESDFIDWLFNHLQVLEAYTSEVVKDDLLLIAYDLIKKGW